MARSRIREVRLERQPHRDAVHRLRQAYRRLWLASRSPEEPNGLKAEALSRPSIPVQEVTR